MTFGKRLKELRRKKGMTLKVLGDHIGSSKGYLSGIEHGKVNPPSDRFVRRIARSLGVPESDMLRLAYFDKVPKEVKSEFRTFAAGPEGGAVPGTPGLIPLLNTAATGYPQDVAANGVPRALVVEFVRIPGISSPSAFALTVCGDDMAALDGTGIRPGDIVVAVPDAPVRDGDAVFTICTLSEGKTALLRSIQLEGKDRIVLKPLNRAYPMHALTKDDVDGLFRIVARIEMLGVEKARKTARAGV